MTPLRILHIVKKVPYPVKDGEAVANNSLSRSMESAGCNVDLLAINTKKHYTDHSLAKAHLDQYTQIEIVDIDTTPSLIGILKSLWKGGSYLIDRFDHPEVHKALIQMISMSNYDIIQLESIYKAPYINTIRMHSTAKIVLRAHNVEHVIWKRLAVGERRWGRRWAMRGLSHQLGYYERQAINRVDLVTSVSPIDQVQLQSWAVGVTVKYQPIGINLDLYKVRTAEKSGKIIIGFIGSLDWRPNIEGIEWFLGMSWPTLLNKHQAVEFRIAGRNISEEQLRTYAKIAGVRVLGEVEDSHDFINQCDILITPLFSGSGMRVKIIEAMALCKPVVTTGMGLEGIPAIDRQHIIVANTALEFADGISEMIDQPALRAQIGREARSFIEQNFNIDQLTKDLISEYSNL